MKPILKFKSGDQAILIYKLSDFDCLCECHKLDKVDMKHRNNNGMPVCCGGVRHPLLAPGDQIKKVSDITQGTHKMDLIFVLTAFDDNNLKETDEVVVR